MSDKMLQSLPNGDELARIALQAGAIIMQVYNDGFHVHDKDDDSPVTIADHRAEAYILQQLRRLAPDIPVLAEEEVAAGREPELGRTFYCVDPLDGTREFIAHRKDFTVNIALIHDHIPVAGVIYAPAHGTLYVADQFGVHWWADGCVTDGEKPALLPEKSRRTPLAVSGRTQDFIALASRSHRSAQTDAFLAKHDVKEIISAGSSLKFCLIATGQADIYPRFTRTMEWDIAAGHALVNAAGGSVIHMDDSPLIYGRKKYGFDNVDFLVRGWG